MTNPAKNRLRDYEAGWLPLLIEMGVATKEQANEAMCRVAQAAIDEKEARQKMRKSRARRQRNTRIRPSWPHTPPLRKP